MSKDLEIVFVAASRDHEERAEAAFSAAAIRFTIGLEANPDASPSAVCYLGVVYSVPRDDAERCRRLLDEAGLRRGIIARELP